MLTHFIEEGYIKQFAFNTDTKEVTNEHYEPSKFDDNFLSFFQKTSSPETFQAITTCKSLGNELRNRTKDFHHFPEIREWNQLLLLSYFTKLQNRTINLIKLLSEQRCAKLITEEPELIQDTLMKYQPPTTAIPIPHEAESAKILLENNLFHRRRKQFIHYGRYDSRQNQ